MKLYPVVIAIAALLSLGRAAPDTIPGRGIGYCGPFKGHRGCEGGRV